MRSTWARLIHKVNEVDPLECPKCKGPMRVIALNDAGRTRDQARASPASAWRRTSFERLVTMTFHSGTEG